MVPVFFGGGCVCHSQDSGGRNDGLVPVVTGIHRVRKNHIRSSLAVPIDIQTIAAVNSQGLP